MADVFIGVLDMHFADRRARWTEPSGECSSGTSWRAPIVRELVSSAPAQAHVCAHSDRYVRAEQTLGEGGGRRGLPRPRTRVSGRLATPPSSAAMVAAGITAGGSSLRSTPARPGTRY